MKFLLSLAVAALVAISAQPAGAESVQRTAAIVDGVVISTYDLEQRIRLVLTSSGGGSSAAGQGRMREQVLRTLIDEIIQLNAAKKDELEVAESDIDAAIAKIAEQNNTTPEKIMESLRANGVSDGTFRTQIKAELAWSKVVEERLAPRVKITDEEVDQELRRIQAGASKPQYLISEIFIGVDAPGDEARARRAIEQIFQQIQAGTPFPALAQEFSESPSAKQGGEVGWVQDEDVAPEVWAQLQRMQPRTISPPVRSAAGYYLIVLRDKMRPAGSAVEAAPAPPGPPPGVPPGSIKLKRVVLGLPPTLSATEKDNFLQAAGILREQIKGCQGLEEFAAKTQGIVILDLPVLPVKDLAPDIRQMIQGLNPSDVSQPFFSTEGEQRLLNLLVVCGDRPRVEFVATRAFEMPTREQVENKMFNQELSNAARRYMRDLRRDAAIEIRDSAVLAIVSN